MTIDKHQGTLVFRLNKMAFKVIDYQDGGDFAGTPAIDFAPSSKFNVFASVAGLDLRVRLVGVTRRDLQRGTPQPEDENATDIVMGLANRNNASASNYDPIAFLDSADPGDGYYFDATNKSHRKKNM